MCELTIQMWRQDIDTEKLRNLWPWPPLTPEQYAHLRGLAPDRAIGRAAAVEYLDKHKEPEPIKVNFFDNVFIPLALTMICVALFGLTASWAFR